jgi:ribosomal protein S12 methylthiotransferase
MISLGCAKNRVDSEQMLGLLRDAGYAFTDDPARAEALIVNTCGFIRTAKEESIDAILDMARYKRQGVCRALVATGCLVQRYADELREEMPEIDAFVGVTEYTRLPEIIRKLLDGDVREATAPIAVTPADARSAIFEGSRVLTTQRATAYIRIADGCDNRCAYCAIPNIRGPFRSRSMSAVLDEASSLCDGGVKEIVYIAQDTTRFGEDTEGRFLLPELLRKTASIPAVSWVRALYAYPSRVSDELLDTLAHTPKVSPYLDVPLQHIDAGVLRRMGRWGDEEAIYALLAKARRLGLTLRTTFLVGFPGESAEAFERLLDFTNTFQFDRMGAFAFSPEEDTPAFAMDGAPPDEIKQERLDQLMRAQRRASLARNRLRVGETTAVLCEKVLDANNNIYEGRSIREVPESDGIVRFRSRAAVSPGEFVQVQVVRARAYDLEGESV